MTPWAYPFMWLLFCLSYFALAFLCLETRDNGSLSSSIWLPAGLTLGVLCASPLSRWPLWAVSAGLLHLFASLLHHRPLDIGLLFALSDLLILCLSAYVWKVIKQGVRITAQFSSMLSFILIILIASLLGGILTLNGLKMFSYPIVFSHFLVWSISNATGCLALTPLFLFKGVKQKIHLIKTPRHGLFLLTCVVVLMLWTFTSTHRYLYQTDITDFALYTLIGMILLTVIFINSRQLSCLFIFTAIVISLSTLLHRGPFAMIDYTASESIPSSQLYTLIIFIFGLLTHSLFHDLDATNKQHQRHLLLINAAYPAQIRYLFHITFGADRLQWQTSDSGNQLFLAHAIITPAQFLGRLHVDDRTLISPYFKGEKTHFTLPLTYSVRVILQDNVFIPAQLALINHWDSHAHLRLHGALFITQENPLNPTGQRE
ncbi:MASE1 domain-containing protein [Rouxiella chamberiensis]|uniref:MASE1 domain-containing protein n=1 Tax=Rouxiella chamberiensis TaxID=1513468 RepID=A0ABY7HPM5_9GAMM|nr:MASE1 domain-containing protein [Rouxiella chamberiensis]WAT01334.1 MASE1 domain-containing protein [Rouxiella chamberiensis]